MARRALVVAIAGACGLLVTAGAILVIAWLADPSECIGPHCALEVAAVVTWALIAGVLAGAACAFAAYVLTAPR